MLFQEGWRSCRCRGVASWSSWVTVRSTACCLAMSSARRSVVPYGDPGCSHSGVFSSVVSVSLPGCGVEVAWYVCNGASAWGLIFTIVACSRSRVAAMSQPPEFPRARRGSMCFFVPRARRGSTCGYHGGEQGCWNIIERKNLRKIKISPPLISRKIRLQNFYTTSVFNK